MNKIVEVKTDLENKVKVAVNEMRKNNPDLDVHSIIVWAYTNVNKETVFAVYADVREKGQIFFGIN